MEADACLGTDTLVELVEGRASGAARDRIEAHAAHCASCRAAMSALARGEPADDLPIERRRIGRYVLREPLGSGGMGVVFTAHDPDLDRIVAIKLLRPDLGGSDAGQRLEDQLRREAQAMAQLAHPNVVAVYDVGTFSGRIFLAMEYVAGATLTGWLAEPHSPREILDAFVAAGRGLAAAHAAQLVHRDFKPENVLVGRDGRVRVSDFGLARSSGGRALATTMPSGSVAADAPTTPADWNATATIAGTPYYMAPEQHRGEPVDARSDQFSFCVALYTALYRQRPFAGESIDELADAVQQGRVAEPPRDARVSRRVRAAIRRGLSARRDDRWPKMDTLLAELEPPSRRWLAATIAAPLAIATAVLAIVVARGPASEPPCGGARAHLAGVWDPPRELAIGAAFSRTGAPYAAASFAEVVRTGEAYTASWVAMHESTCEATRVRGEQTEDMLGLRMTCLDARLRELAQLTGDLANADRGLVERSVYAMHELSPIDDCGNLAALASAVRPPADAATRAKVDAARQRLAAIRGEQRAGHYQPALADVRAVIADTTALGYRPLEGEAKLLAGELSEEIDDNEGAATFLADAALAAEAGRDDATLAAALLDAITVVGHALARHEEADRLQQRARAVVERVGSPPHLAATLAHASGALATDEGRMDDARRELDRAVALIEHERGDHDLELAEPLRAIGSLLVTQDHAREARAFLERSLAIVRRAYGDDHPEVAHALEALAGADYMSVRYSDAEHGFLAARAIYVRAYGEANTRVANLDNNLADVYEWQGRLDESIAAHRHAVAVDERVLGPKHPTTLAHLSSLASSLEDGERHVEARALLERVLVEQRAQLGPRHQDIALTLSHLADVELAMGNSELARAHAQESYEMFDRVLGAKYRPAAELRELGQAALAQGRPGDALAPLDRALASLLPDDDAGTRAWIEGLLGRALVDSGRDRVRGRVLVEQAWSHMTSDDRMDGQRADLAAWRAKHGMK